jgi:hypothetical protein
MATRNGCIWLGALLALASLANPAAAREGWNCNYADQGADPARYVTRLEKHGHELIEPHWAAPIAYHILVDTRDMLVAVHAYAEPPSFRRDPRGIAVVLIINKYTGQMRRSSGGSGEADDHILTGSCERI